MEKNPKASIFLTTFCCIHKIRTSYHIKDKELHGNKMENSKLENNFSLSNYSNRISFYLYFSFFFTFPPLVVVADGFENVKWEKWRKMGKIGTSPKERSIKKCTHNFMLVCILSFCKRTSSRLAAGTVIHRISHFDDTNSHIYLFSNFMIVKCIWKPRVFAHSVDKIEISCRCKLDYSCLFYVPFFPSFSSLMDVSLLPRYDKT